MSAPRLSLPRTRLGQSNSPAARLWPLIAALLVLAEACGGPNQPGGSPSPSASPLSISALKLAVLEAVGGSLVYCDPDQFPLPVRNDLEGARDRLATIRADRQAFRAILEHEHLSSTAAFTPDELIAINEDYKQIQAIELDPADDRYRFTVQAPGEGSSGIQRLTGIVDRWGAVMIERTEVGHTPNCPICLAAGVRIATPSGEIPVAELRVGMPVWTTDLSGRHIAGIVLEIGHMDAPLGHEVVRLELSDGRTVLASPGHPTADGGTVGQLEPGDRYQGAVVAGAMLVPYAGETWDLLPSGPSGTYFANGVPLDSSL